MRRNTLIVLLALVAALAGTFAWLQRERAAEVPALPAAGAGCRNWTARR